MTACSYRVGSGCGAPDGIRAACPLAVRCAAKLALAAGVAKRLTGTAGECTADLFDARASDVPLFAWAGGGAGQKGVTA